MDMSREEKQRVGRLMAAAWPLLGMVAKTPWLLVLVLPFLTAFTYNGGYVRDKFVPVVVSGKLELNVWGAIASVGFRPTANKKGSICSVRVVSTTSYKYAAGIA